MKSSFENWESIHGHGDILTLSQDREGLLWLKLKSIMRKDIIKDFIAFSNISLRESKLRAQFEELFYYCSKDIEGSHSILNEFFEQENEKVLKALDIDKMISELYKLKMFDWGGDYNNSLDKFLVRHYVKAIDSYDTLVSKFKTEIEPTVKRYVMNSWYNHWSSILIEHIFKSHPSVLPTVGKIKNVDFFINDVPFDLKVTYFPNEYMKQKRKEHGLPAETSYLKQKAKELGIAFDKNGSAEDMKYEITEKLNDRNDSTSLAALNTLKLQRMKIVEESIENPKQLMTWLYENQGEMRFGSENRLFLILVDKSNFNESWKLKRNIDVLRPTIYNYLERFTAKDINKINFSYNGNNYKALADTIFIIK